MRSFSEISQKKAQIEVKIIKLSKKMILTQSGINYLPKLMALMLIDFCHKFLFQCQIKENLTISKK